jgi:DNA-binding SARP family transcriptional activator
LHTLGSFEILRDDEPLRSTGKAQLKPLELLKCLCAFGGQRVSQHRVTDLLWPDSEGDAADQALRTTLHRLRKLLQNERAVRLEDRQLYLNPEVVWADFMAFDAAELPPQAADPAALQRTLALYRGPFLAGPFRERLRAQHVRLAERLGAMLDGAGIGPAADHYRRAIETATLQDKLDGH